MAKYLKTGVFKASILMGLIAILSLPAFAKRKPKKLPSQMSTSQLEKLMRKVATRKARCEQKNCDTLKILIEYSDALKVLVRNQKELGFRRAENKFLNKKPKSNRGIASVAKGKGCLKKHILKESLVNHGIQHGGSILFSKKATDRTDSICWTNAKKRVEGTISVCNFPQGIIMRTKGGPDTGDVIRERHYFFGANKCDLTAVKIVDDWAKGKTETSITYNECMKHWNKRTADAAMTPKQVRLMENMIGFCFRNYLLPPRGSLSGYKNPSFKSKRMPGQKPAK